MAKHVTGRRVASRPATVGERGVQPSVRENVDDLPAALLQGERGSVGATSGAGPPRFEDSMRKSAFVQGLLFAVGFVRLTAGLASEERAGEGLIYRLMGRWNLFDISFKSQHNIHSNRSYASACAKDRYPCLLRRLRARPINDDRDWPATRFTTCFAQRA